MNKEKITIIGLLFLSFCLFFQNLSYHGIEFRDDEIFYFNSTREMVETGDFLSPKYFGRDRFQKPILFYWLMIISYQIFGVNWLGARFAAVVFASLTVGLTWAMAREFFTREVALMSGLVLMTIPLFFRHAKNAVPDMALNFFIVLALYAVIKFVKDPGEKRYRYLFFISCALGFMIKGFAAIVIPFLTCIVYALLIKKPRLLREMDFPLGLGIMLLIILPWFLYMAAVHGDVYTDYMLKTETLNRMVSQDQQNPFFRFIQTFSNNFLFYLRTLSSYFAPWMVFAVGAVPWAVRMSTKTEERTPGFLLMTTWFFVGLIFFSSIFARINHLILVLSTPFAILVSCFLLESFNRERWGGRMMHWVRTFFIFLIIFFGVLGFVGLRVLIVGSSGWWLLLGGILMVLSLWIIFQKRKDFLSAGLLGAFMVFCYFQTGVISQAGLTAHSTMQRFADTINRAEDKDSIVGVGSHDIHEKAFQVYFDREVQKVVNSLEGESQARLVRFFSVDQTVYCLITEKDYEKFLKSLELAKIDIVQEDFMVRKRVSIDRGFFKALVRLDQKTVHDYLMEKVILIKKANTI